MSKILTSSHGPAVVLGGERLPHDEEVALNLLLRRSGGETDGVPNFKLGWALEDNHSTWNSIAGRYDYDPEKKTPICFHENQASYHLLSWEPPSAGLIALEGQLKGEDVDRGTWNCLLHFLDEQGNPRSPKPGLIEIIMPTILQLTEIAIAARKGFDATRATLRAEKIARLEKDEERKKSDYMNYADSLLDAESPAFEGKAFSASGEKRRHFSDLKPGETLTVASADVPTAEKASEAIEQPAEFAFSARPRKRL